MSQPLQHGGALDVAIERYGGFADEWLDLSTGINPEGLPVPEMESALWKRLPEQSLMERTLKKARAFYGVPDDTEIIAGPGTQSLIQLLPEIIGEPGEVDIVAPTYGEYAASFSRCGWRVNEIGNVAATSPEARAVVVVNPNNPDGRVTGPDLLSGLRGSLAKRGGLLIVDEAFQDASDNQSATSHAQSGAIVLKSFGKFFGLAGMRIGFAITNPDIVSKLAARLGPWAVSGPALAAADRIFADEEAISEMRSRIAQSARMLEKTLEQAGLASVGATGLFRLARHKRAGMLFEALCRQKVLVRPFDYEPEWLRFGLARRADYPRLRAALACAIAEIAD
jgi:cobalamin biosynthetic protein CobC